VSLRDGRAWVTDGSAHGTWRNGARLPKGQPQPLATGDHVALAQVLSFRVELVAVGPVVQAVWLFREPPDPLAGRLAYLLTPNRMAVPLTTHPGAWMAWKAGPRLAVHAETGGWATPEPDTVCDAGAVRVRWTPVEKSIDQDDWPTSPAGL
jgi:hypothetical protein